MATTAMQSLFRNRLVILAVPVVLVALWALVEQSPEMAVFRWSTRVAIGLSVVMFFAAVLMAQRRVKSVPVASLYPVEPLAMLKLLKTLQPMEPHCLWAGNMGQLWGLHVRGHQSQLPFAQDRGEVWLAHLQGASVEVDGLDRVHAIHEGEWLKLPKGIGKGGLRSDGSYVLWMTGKA